VGSGCQAVAEGLPFQLKFLVGALLVQCLGVAAHITVLYVHDADVHAFAILGQVVEGEGLHRVAQVETAAFDALHLREDIHQNVGILLPCAELQTGRFAHGHFIFQPMEPVGGAEGDFGLVFCMDDE